MTEKPSLTMNLAPKGVLGVVTDTKDGPVIRSVDPQAPNTPALTVNQPVFKTPPPAKPLDLPAHPADRTLARAQLAAVYAGLQGVDVLASDLVEAMAPRAVDPMIPPGPDMLSDALTDTGLICQIKTIQPPSPGMWPALAEMTGGQLILVLGQDDSGLSIYDPTCADNKAQIPLDDFAPHFTGVILQARASIEKINETHGTDATDDHWFWGEFPKFRRHIGEVALGSFVANLLAVAVALFALQVYDRVIPNQSVATLWVLALGAALAIVMEGFLKLARARLMDGGGRAIEMSINRLLMERLLGMRSDQRPNTPSGLFSTMREFSSVREFFTSSTIGTLTDIPFIFLFLALVASIAGNVVWLLIIGGILMVLPGYFMQKKMMRLTEETQGATAKSTRLLHEAIYELDTVKAQRGEARFQRMWDELSGLASLKSSEQRRLAAFLTYWSQGVQQATYIGTIVLGTYLVFAGQFTVGTIIAVGILTGRTLAPLTQLAGTMARWSNVKTALTGLDMIVQSAQERDGGRTYLRRDTLTGTFDLREVTYKYNEEGAPTVDVPGLAIKPGQSLAVLGANGSGKSTLLKLLSGLYAPTTGRVLVDGIDISQIDNRDLRRHVGYLSQDVRLFTGTLRDNLNLNLLERNDDRLFDALDFAGVGEFVRNHPRGLDLEISDNGEGLSVGQRQSIGWARMWLQDPKIVLLDEPTSALDQTLEATLVHRLESWLEQRTAIIATHRMPILALTDRVVVLQNGRLAVDGPRDKVLAHLTEARTSPKRPAFVGGMPA